MFNKFSIVFYNIYTCLSILIDFDIFEDPGGCKISGCLAGWLAAWLAGFQYFDFCNHPYLGNGDAWLEALRTPRNCCLYSWRNTVVLITAHGLGPHTPQAVDQKGWPTCVEGPTQALLRQEQICVRLPWRRLTLRKIKVTQQPKLTPRPPKPLD